MGRTILTPSRRWSYIRTVQREAGKTYINKNFRVEKTLFKMNLILPPPIHASCIRGDNGRWELIIRRGGVIRLNFKCLGKGGYLMNGRRMAFSIELEIFIAVSILSKGERIKFIIGGIKFGLIL